jgi:aryl-alcohol dehydrogenase-like predicted oxidoreductase
MKGANAMSQESHMPLAPRRPLGKSGYEVTPVALGCWPIAGVTTLGTNEADSLATVTKALDMGINHLDTAYVYGPNGESEVIVGRAIAGRRDEVVLATKGGIHYEGSKMTNDARPETLKRECDESLRRLGTDHVELYYLHALDTNTPVEESAGAIRDLIAAGKAKSAGASNLRLEDLKRFHAVCPVAAVQLPYNMLQRGIEQETIPWCQANQVAVMVYWPLMKGLLAGKLQRDHVFDQADSRLKYPMFQGEEWQRNQDFLDRLREVAAGLGATVAQLVVAWTIAQQGITAALCGAKRPDQIAETASALQLKLTPEVNAEIADALAARGTPVIDRNFT